MIETVDYNFEKNTEHIIIKERHSKHINRAIIWSPFLREDFQKAKYYMLRWLTNSIESLIRGVAMDWGRRFHLSLAFKSLS